MKKISLYKYKPRYVRIIYKVMSLFEVYTTHVLHLIHVKQYLECASKSRLHWKGGLTFQLRKGWLAPSVKSQAGNTRRCSNVELTLAHRRRRWASVDPALAQRLVCVLQVLISWRWDYSRSDIQNHTTVIAHVKSKQLLCLNCRRELISARSLTVDIYQSISGRLEFYLRVCFLSVCFPLIIECQTRNNHYIYIYSRMLLCIIFQGANPVK